jgi:hypothetical protein
MHVGYPTANACVIGRLHAWGDGAAYIEINGLVG